MILITACSSLLLILAPSKVGFVLSYGDFKVSEFPSFPLETLLHSSFRFLVFLSLVSLGEVVNLFFDLCPEFLEVGQRTLGLVPVLHQDPFNNLLNREVAGHGS